jgi:hypothetical protein
MIRRTPTRRPVLALLASGALLAASAAACSSGHGEEGCPEFCEALLACPAVDTTEEQCLSSCKANEETAEAKGCTEQHERLLECYGHAEDVCDPKALDAECTVQDQAYKTCVGSG